MANPHFRIPLTALALIGAIGITSPEVATAASNKSKGAAPAPVSAQPSVTTASFGDWTLRCVEGAGKDGGAACEVIQSIVLSGQQAPVAQLALGRLEATGGLQVTVVLPVNVALLSPATVSEDPAGKDAVALTWQRCIPGGCFASAPAEDAMIAAWKAASTPGTLSFDDATGRKVALPFSLRGLTQALEAMQK